MGLVLRKNEKDFCVCPDVLTRKIKKMSVADGSLNSVALNSVVLT